MVGLFSMSAMGLTGSNLASKLFTRRQKVSFSVFFISIYFDFFIFGFSFNSHHLPFFL